MVVEIALIDVLPGHEDDFAAAYRSVRHEVATTPGCRSVRMTRGVESPSRFVLLVEWDSVAAHEDGFRFVARERFENRVAFSVAELVRCLLTQSNVIAAVEEGKERPEEVDAWLTHSIAPLFTAPRGGP